MASLYVGMVVFAVVSWLTCGLYAGRLHHKFMRRRVGHHDEGGCLVFHHLAAFLGPLSLVALVLAGEFFD